MSNFRCVICDAVNNKEIENHPGQYLVTPGVNFYPDPKDEKDFICYKCKSSHDESMYEYYLDDLERLSIEGEP